MASVEDAFALGWQVAQLFHQPVPEGPGGSGPCGDRLPGLAALPAAEQSILLARRVSVAAAALPLSVDGTSVGAAATRCLDLFVNDPRDQKAISQAVFDLHIAILEGLTVSDAGLGKAYSLGQALAETVLVSCAADDAGLDSAYRQALADARVDELSDWLADLKADFGAHAAYAVRGSLDRWHIFVSSSQTPIPPTARHAMSAQGRVWQGLLSGEKPAVEFLAAMDYVAGASALLGRIGQLTGRFLWSAWGVLLVAAIAVVAGVTVGLSELSTLSTGSKVAADLVTALAAVGLTTKGVMSSLGRVIGHSEGPLWESELDESCAVAATRLPDGVRVARRSLLETGSMR